MPAMRTLFLVPTELERRVLQPLVAPALGRDGVVELCGFGPVAAAARTSLLVARHQPVHVLLVGIAGRIDQGLALATAYRFQQVACFGIGVGSRDEFIPAGTLGWPQWPGDTADGSPAIGDVIDCGPREASAAVPGAKLLLTACAASATADDVRTRKRLFPAAVAEDMEGFAVAFACRLAGVPCEIVRGISNSAGDRDQSRWQTKAALEAAGELAAQVIAEAS
ncbi:MAG: futalosine hydrolase [Planctomycetes bacterium]|nr:futalosine hydrolase [Planctomycetota bacterium]